MPHYFVKIIKIWKATVLGVYTRTPNSIGVSWSVEGFSGSRERHSCKMNKFHSIFWSFPFERRFKACYTWAPTLPKDLESRCRSNQPTSIELSLSYPLAFPPLTVKMKCLQCLLQRWAIALLTRQRCCGSCWAEMNLQVAVHETAYVSTRTANKKSCWSKERAITVYQP